MQEQVQSVSCDKCQAFDSACECRSNLNVPDTVLRSEVTILLVLSAL